jgi:hypothetical protein
MNDLDRELREQLTDAYNLRQRLYPYRDLPGVEDERNELQRKIDRIEGMRELNRNRR